MCKSRFLAIFFGMLLVLSNTSEARVCFLSGSNDFNCSSGTYEDYIKVSKCSGYALCDKPSNNPGKTCEEEDITHYLPEDCCSNTSLYEPCDSPKVCDGTVCESGLKAPAPKPGMSIMRPKNPWRSYCEIGKCHCPATYTQTCDGNGQIGAFLDGTPDEEGCVDDDGVTIYEACICGSGYEECGENTTAVGESCTDSFGATKYLQCTCEPATAQRPEGDNWVADPSYCCEGYVKECKGHNASDAYYCRPVSTPMGLCGYTMDGACYGADRGYDYVTTSATKYATVQCDDTWTYSNRYCGTNCTCATGYFDYNTVCTAAGSNICSELGYTEDSCEGDSIACPYDASAKKCIEAACTYYTKAHCETPANKICTEDEYGCWNLTSCAEGYRLLGNRCMRNTCTGYRLTSCPEGATCDECKKGATTMYKKTGCKTNYWSTEAECEASPWSLDSSRNNEGYCVQPSTNACWRVKTCSEMGDNYMEPTYYSIREYITTDPQTGATWSWPSGSSSPNMTRPYDRFFTFSTAVYPGYVRCIQPVTGTGLGLYNTINLQDPPYDYRHRAAYTWSDITNFSSFKKVHDERFYKVEFYRTAGSFGYLSTVITSDDFSNKQYSSSEVISAMNSYALSSSLPNVAEMNTIKNNIDTIQQLLAGAELDTFKVNGACYWAYGYDSSTTPNASKLYKFYKNTNTGRWETSGPGATGNCYIRPVEVYRNGCKCGKRTSSSAPTCTCQ